MALAEATMALHSGVNQRPSYTRWENSAPSFSRQARVGLSSTSSSTARRCGDHDGTARGLVAAAGLHAHHAVLGDVDPAHAVLAGTLVQGGQDLVRGQGWSSTATTSPLATVS